MPDILNSNSSTSRGNSWWVAVAVGAGTLLTWFVLWKSTLPLGIPGEWVWNRHDSQADFAWNMIWLTMVAAGYFGVVWWRFRQLESLSELSQPIHTGRWLIVLSLAGFVWIWSVQEAAPPPLRLAKGPFVLYYPAASGYFFKARYQEPDPVRLLATYESQMEKGDVLHEGTHPPGLFLYFHGAWGLCERLPLLTQFLVATIPDSFRDAAEVLQENIQASKSRFTFGKTEIAVVWLTTLLVMLLAAITVIPLHQLLAKEGLPQQAWILASLWPLVPAVAIFVPKSDVAFACLSVWLVSGWRDAWDRGSLWKSAGVGLLAWCSILLSLAFLPIFLIMSLLPIAKSLASGDWLAWRTRWKCIAAAAAVFLLATILLGLFCQISLPNVFWHNYRNHAGFYQQFTRSYGPWLLVNVVELTMAVGWPIALLALLGLGRKIARRRFASAEACVVAAVWAILWVSGKNAGEAARLWIFLMPFLLWIAIEARPRTDQEKAESSGILTSRSLMFVLAAQLATCALTVIRVGGFHDPARTL